MATEKRVVWASIFIFFVIGLLIMVIFVAISGCGNALASRTLPGEAPPCDRCCCMMTKMKDCHHSCKLIPPERAPTEGENHMCGELCHLKSHGCNAKEGHEYGRNNHNR